MQYSKNVIPKISIVIVMTAVLPRRTLKKKCCAFPQFLKYIPVVYNVIILMCFFYLKKLNIMPLSCANVYFFLYYNQNVWKKWILVSPYRVLTAVCHDKFMSSTLCGGRLSPKIVHKC